MRSSPSGRFQTLIGTVKSRQREGADGRGASVSNPHRYGQKLHPRRRAGPACVVSNPHRYGQKPALRRGGPGPHRVSNPHRYGQKTSTNLNTTTSFFVSNPHRYGQKNLLGGDFRSLGAPFQTLIGTVKSDSGWGKVQERLQFQTLIGTVKRGGPGAEGSQGP